MSRCALPALLVLLGLSGCGAAPAGAPLKLPPSSRLPASRDSHVLVIVMENAEYDEVIGNPEAPYVNSLARRYGLASRSYAITHPSLPNYLALTGGSTAGIGSDCTSCSDPDTSIADQLDAAGISWKAYLEGLPRPCFTGAASGAYAKKHDPFAYYPRLVSDQRSCRRIVGFDQLAEDLRTGSLPTYAWISPNLCDDGHDCRLRTADGFLARTVPPLLRELGPQGFLVLTWDEGTTDAGCCGVAHGGHIATIVAGPQVQRGARSTAAIDDYGVLGSIERALGLAPLGGASDPRAGSLDDLFATPPSLR